MTDFFAEPVTLGVSLISFAFFMCCVTYFSLSRVQRQSVRALKKEFQGQNTQLKSSMQDIETRLASARVAETKLIEKIQLDISQVQSDLEWLTGERMVDQAVALAKAGVQSDDILRETGYTQDDVDLISRFRRH